MGLTDPAGLPYLLWSGIFGDVTVFISAFAVVKHINCHYRGCWRVGRHHVGEHLVCHKHHERGRLS